MIKFTQNQSSTLSVSRQTLRALTAGLYDGNGTDMSPIIDDLTRSGMDPDLTALNVALLLKKPELCDIPEEDKTMRCSAATLPKGSRYGTSITVYEFKSYSLLHDKVEYVSRTFDVYSEESTDHPNTIEPLGVSVDHMTYEGWKRLSVIVPAVLIEHINDERGTFIERPAE